MVKNLPAMQENRVRSLVREDLEKGMACLENSTEEHGELQSMGSQRVGHNCANNTFTFLTFSLTSLNSGSSLFS